MKIVILGGGISGLSAAWYLRKKHPDAKITLIEKQGRLGGCIQSTRTEGFFFEKGPRTFMASRSQFLLDLIEEVGLKNDLIFSQSAKRYLWHQGKLRGVSSFLPMLLPALVREPFIAKKVSEDESIYDFASRRFGPKIAETLFDPMALGVFAGNIRDLSLRSCFPVLHEWEQKKGSVVWGMLFRRKKKTVSGLFTLRHGIGSLVDAIAKKVPVEIHVNCPVEAIRPEGVEAGGKFWSADRIISALPGLEIGRLTQSWVDFPAQSLWVVSFAFPENSLQKRGFGYLVPSQEKEALLGAIWDSSVFPQQNLRNEVRLTAMVRDQGDATWAVAIARGAFHRHLGIQAEPLYVCPHYALDAIPQFEVGYGKRLVRFREEIKQKVPNLSLVGNYIDGASVDSCIRTAKRL
jgi:oxygen-dependent protoporphyrinogen oxidase